MSGASRPPVLVLAVGNPSRGDDAVGPRLAERLELAMAAGVVGPEVEVIGDAQLMVEHALDVVGRRAVIFIDAAVSEPGAVAWRPVTPARSGLTVTTHACSPAQLLRLVEGTLGEAPPPARVLSVGGHGFELGAPLHEETARALEVAWRLLLVELQELGVSVVETTVPGVAGA